MRAGRPVALKNNEHRVQPLHTKRGELLPIDALQWDDLRFFLAVATHGSLRAAAESERVSVNTVRARIRKLEEACAAPVLRRSRKGSTTTDTGEALLKVAREMRSAALATRRRTAGNVLVAPGEVRIACSEGLGLLWLTPRLTALHDAVEGHTVNLRLDYDLARDSSAAVDIALTFNHPRDPDMIVAKLATLHYMMFASAGYLANRGTPTSLDQIREHRLVEQVTPGVNSWLLDFVLGTDRSPERVALRTNSSLAQLWAVASGAGIAPMPTYVRSITRNVIPIDPPLNLRFELFYAFHAGAKGSPAIDSAIAWLRKCFDPHLYPWFRGEFVHPNDFPRPERQGRVVSLFENLIDPVAGPG